MNKYSFFQNNWLALKDNNRVVQTHIAPYCNGTVYDLGCGTRPYEDVILEFANRYIGVDWSETIHDLKADIVADLNKVLPIESNAADTVVSFQVLEHLSEPLAMLKESHRILKEDGCLFLTVPFQWWVHEAPHDYFRYTPYGLRHLLKCAGFSAVEVHPAAGFFTMWILKANYFSSRYIIGPKILRLLIFALLVPFWLIGQVLAPWLDLLDRTWDLETSGYWVVARKKNA